MDIKKTRDYKKAIAEKHKQYLALQYEIFKYQLQGKPPPTEIIEKARKIKTPPEFQ